MISGALTKDDLVSAVQSLNTLTRNGNLSWQTCEAGPNYMLTLLSNSKSFCVAYEGRILRITSAGSKDQVSYRLEILDKEGGNTLYQFPSIQGIADLYFTVEITLANVENIIRSLAGKRD
jgi:hypothetical protein